MKKKTGASRLAISRETLTELTAIQMSRAGGGDFNQSYFCPPPYTNGICVTRTNNTCISVCLVYGSCASSCSTTIIDTQ